MPTFDHIIIGAGPGGYELAAMLHSAGATVAVIERNQPGGTCLNCGCIPTKCLVATADTLRSCQGAAEMGVICPDAKVDYPAAAARMRSVIEELRGGVMASLAGVEYIHGEARLLPGLKVEVDGSEYKASGSIIIATGSAPAPLRVPGAEFALDSTAALALEQLPESAVIVGGGVIGMELASIWATMGSRVTVVEYCREILPGFDPELAKRLRTYMGRRGVEIVTGAAVTEILPDGGVRYTGKRGEAQVDASVTVCAVGRRPVIPQGCEECGIQLTARGFIAVDSMMRTTAAGIFAIGDVNGLSMLAHSATAQARVVATGNAAAFDTSRVPGIVFTHPELAQVGQVPEGVETRVVKRLFSANGKARAMGEAEGLVKMTCRASDNAVLAVSILGPHAADLIAEAAILVTDRIRMDEIPQRYIHAHPTLSEIFA